MNQSCFTKCVFNHLRKLQFINSQKLFFHSTTTASNYNNDNCVPCWHKFHRNITSSFIYNLLNGKHYFTKTAMNGVFPQYTTDAATTDNELKKTSSDSDSEDFQSNHLNGVLSLDEIYQFIIDENGRDIFVIQLSKSVNYVDYFIVVTANSSRHLAYMAESLNRLYKQRKSEKDPFKLIEGRRTSKDWQCVDFGNAVVHFMLEEVRQKYQLEKLWLLGPKFDDLTLESPTLEELLEKASGKGLFLLSDPGDSSGYVDDVEIVNPWEIEYKGDEAFQEKQDDDEDAYII